MKMALTEIARLVDGELTGNENKLISGVAAFDEADDDQITYASRPAFLKRIGGSGAGAVIVPRHFRAEGKNLVGVNNPQAALARIIGKFFPVRDPGVGIDSKADVGKNFYRGKELYVGPCAVIGDRVRCGSRVKIHAGVVIGPEVTIGDDVTIYPNVTIGERCRIGNRVIIHPGTVIGSDGFGFAPDGGKYIKIPHTGIVQIDDDVEIGANNTIDRGTFGKTWLKKGVKTDNLVQIAHNVIVGKHSALVAQVGISGSTTLGRHAILAGQAGVSGHLRIGDNVTIGPQAGVAKSIESGQTVSGSPGLPHRLWLKVSRIIPRLPDLMKRLSKLEKRIKTLENKPTE
ncbi:MAG: UDP-3-O-(3-hydroxymyristoyl)glucosamine N-acyltransferase [Thermodesulfobacteriota bacterium]|nr:UDP-3-O-(3-hydroxymyristoyl)glucosamine N-acyltransferase [Thermodesulfobacteriota bacterium]